MTVGFRGGGIDGPGFGIAIGADDKVWATGLRAQTFSVFDRKTGQPLSPETGYNFAGQLGSMQGIITTPTDVAIDPAGNVWVANNWDRPDEGFKKVPEPALTTRFGGNGTVVFFGLAKPVKTPLIGPPRAP